MISDFKRAGEGQRKPLNFKDALYKHQVCGAYLHFKSEFQSRCPEKEWPTLSQEIDDSFYQRLLDTDLHAAMLSSVPPGDLLAISSFRHWGSVWGNQMVFLNLCGERNNRNMQILFSKKKSSMVSYSFSHSSIHIWSHLARPHLGRFQKVQVAELEAKEDRLARSVLEATFNQLSAQLDHDMALVKEKLCHDKDAEAVESAKDARFLRECQLILNRRLYNNYYIGLQISILLWMPMARQLICFPNNTNLFICSELIHCTSSCFLHFHLKEGGCMGEELDGTALCPHSGGRFNVGLHDRVCVLQCAIPGVSWQEATW